LAETAIGKYLKAAREAAGIKKWALAEKSGISHTEIHRIENGDRVNPSIKNIKAICKVLNIPVVDALKAGGYISGATDMDSYLEELYKDSNAKVIAEKVKTLRESKQLTVEQLAKAANLSPQIVGSLEAGEALCDYNDFVSITSVFGVPALRLLSESESAEDLIKAIKSSGDELLEGLSKSEDLVKTLFRAKNASKETMDQMAEFINVLLKQSGYSNDDNK